jgi:hypothetical protein
VKVYVVCEYPHGQDDAIHEIVLVTADPDEAERKSRPDYTFFVAEYDVDPTGRKP